MKCKKEGGKVAFIWNKKPQEQCQCEGGISSSHFEFTRKAGYYDKRTRRLLRCILLITSTLPLELRFKGLWMMRNSWLVGLIPMWRWVGHLLTNIRHLCSARAVIKALEPCLVLMQFAGINALAFSHAKCVGGLLTEQGMRNRNCRMVNGLLEFNCKC